MSQPLEKKVKTVLFSSEQLPLESYGTHYGVRIYCKNCGKDDHVRIKKGTPKKGLTVNCRECECEIDL